MPPLTANDAPFLTLTAPDGAGARVYLDGAHVASWRPAGGSTSGDEQLFVSARAFYGPGYAIRGGIPICWPQFGKTGPLQQHGFARLMRWSVVRETVDAQAARAVLRLTDSDATRALWPFSFNAELAVSVFARTLRVELTVTNTDAQPLEFTAALHPYFRVRDALAVDVLGLEGCRYRDALQGGAEFREAAPAVQIPGPIDRVYLDTPAEIALREPHRTLRIIKSGFPETVVWNPGASGTSSREDFAPGDEQVMVCVEAAAVDPRIVVVPGDQWTGVQEMIAD